MEVFKIEITSWTASFRYPNIISGVQPTLKVPPLSTVLGLLNAAAGKYLIHKKLSLGYHFEYEALGEDLETIYQFSAIDKIIKGVKKKAKDSYGNYQVSNKVKSNVLKREFLFNNRLCIYFTDEEFANYFRKPHYQILLGRSSDLATVGNISKITLEDNNEESSISGQIIPLSGHFLPGQIQALPQYFSNTIPRENLGTQPYSVIDCDTDVETNVNTYYDKEEKRAIYFHQLIFDTND